MSLITVEKQRCTKDAICAHVCPRAIIRLNKADGYPEMVPGGEMLCMRCGHCVAVCPNGALSHVDTPIGLATSIEEGLNITPQQTEQFLRSRRSIRHYLDKPVAKEIIERLIEIARYAPTGSNTQLVQWLVITDKERIRGISKLAVDWMRELLKGGTTTPPYLPQVVAAWDAGYDAVLRGAPTLIVAIAPRETRNGLVEVTLSLAYFELAAQNMGLGTCWAGMLQHAIEASPKVKAAVGIPEGFPHHYPMMLGYPRYRYYRLPQRRPPQISWG